MTTTLDAEWHHTPPPFTPDQPLTVWLEDGSVRAVILRPERDPCSLWFTDCTRPEQNAYCSREFIKAWKFA